MNLETQILAAVLLDLVIGDPRGFPHPVRAIGALAVALEKPMRNMFSDARSAGKAAAAIIVGSTVLSVWLILQWASSVHAGLADALSIYFLYSGVAARDMVDHASAVYKSLRDGNLEEARKRTAMICGRDTQELDEHGMVRATVESTAENLNDGVIAPLFFAAIGGPVIIWAYKAVSTLDSTFGYKNERYLEFGCASAKLDDFTAWLPARISGFLVPLAAMFIGLDWKRSLDVLRRDGYKHPSPNAGKSEAAVAGALGVILGGPSSYGGVISDKPVLGSPGSEPTLDHIMMTNALFIIAALLSTALFIGIRSAVFSSGQ